MTQEEFIRRREPLWQELQAMLTRVAQGRRLDADTVERFGFLYRRAAADLAYARAYYPGTRVTRYLNELVLRAHSRVYAPPKQGLSRLWHLLAREFPRLVRRQWCWVVLAWALLLGGVALGYFASLFDPNLARAFTPDMVHQIEPHDLTGTLAPAGERPALAVFLMQHNIGVALRVFAEGLTLGLLTIYELLVNGVLLGALAVVFQEAGIVADFWATILPHGVVELSAIALAGAGGFQLAWAILRPGPLPRLESLARTARSALALALGMIPFFIIAGLIEGLVTPLPLGAWPKIAIGVGSGALVWAWLLLGGRRATPEPVAQANPGHPNPGRSARRNQYTAGEGYR
jgi:uncharacterized membrane protein SpoIIM required for sporulation